MARWWSVIRSVASQVVSVLVASGTLRVWYFTVTLAPGRTTAMAVAPEQLAELHCWIANYRQLKQRLEEICTINRELLRREHRQPRLRAARTHS